MYRTLQSQAALLALTLGYTAFRCQISLCPLLPVHQPRWSQTASQGARFTGGSLAGTLPLRGIR